MPSGQCTLCGRQFPYLRNSACGQCTEKTRDPSQCDVIDALPQCDGCGSTFERLDQPICGMCTKKSTAKSDVDVESRNMKPQCQSCGCVFQFMRGTVCGACSKESSAPISGKNTVTAVPAVDNKAKSKVAQIAARTSAYEKSASQHRLHQGSRSDASSTASTKRQISQLKELRTIAYHNIDVSLFHHTSQNKISKVIEGVTRKTHDSSKDVKSLFSQAVLAGGRELYDSSSKDSRGMHSPFTWDDTIFETQERLLFYIASAGRGIGHLVNVEGIATLTTRQWFDMLVGSNMLSEKNKKDKVIPINICIQWQNMDHDDDSDIEIIGETRTASGSLYRSGIMTSPPAKSALKRKRGPELASSVKAKSVKRSNGAIARASASVVPEMVYQSAFKIPKRTISYTTYAVTTTSCIVNQNGTVANTVSNIEEQIHVVDNWKADLKSYLTEGTLIGDTTFIGRGSSKLAFLGTYKTRQYAILQTGPLGVLANPNSQWGDEASNRRDLLNELQLLALGQYFVDSFYRRADCSQVRHLLPNIRFNIDGAFLGTVVVESSGSENNDSKLISRDLTPGTAPLLWSSFLAVPFITSSDGYTLTKFSGAFEAGNNTSCLGMAIDAFAHHVLVDSQYTCVLVDLQGFIHEGRKEVILIDPQAHTQYVSTSTSEQ